jgi:phosphatidylethanolamine-binding protein (PEBP) family uncharacterized protein
MFKRRLILTAAGLAAVTILPSIASAMSVKFSWAGYTACSSRSPAFTVSDVPAGTVKLAFKMIDKEVPTYPHGGGTIVYSGSSDIPAGAFSYKGPCPPSGQQHSYQWTVHALDAKGQAIASTSALEKFPPQ